MRRDGAMCAGVFWVGSAALVGFYLKGSLVEGADNSDRPVTCVVSPLVAEPGSTDAQEFALARSQVEAGLTPVALPGGGPADSIAPPDLAWRTVLAAPIAEATEFERRFAERFEFFDPQPPEREAHYAWVPQVEGIDRIGWTGAVLGSINLDGSATLVVVSLVPSFHSGAGVRTTMFDAVTETYAVAADGSFEMIASDAAIPNPEAQFFPPPILWGGEFRLRGAS